MISVARPDRGHSRRAGKSKAHRNSPNAQKKPLCVPKTSSSDEFSFGRFKPLSNNAWSKKARSGQIFGRKRCYIFSRAGFRLFWFAPFEPLPHGPVRRCKATGASSYDHLGWRSLSFQSGELPKKTAPVRARVCAVIVEDSHRLKGGGDACAQQYLTTSQRAAQIIFHL